MASYSFETIQADQALAITASDILTFASGSANQASVAYSPLDLPLPARIEVTVAGRTVVFGTELADLTQRGGAVWPDGSKLFIGGDQGEQAFGSDGGDALYGGGGADTLYGGQGDDVLQGNVGDDVLTGGLGANTLHGGKGDDSLFAASEGETRGAYAHGNQGNDEVIGGGGADTLLGGQGDDFMAGRDGDDYLSGDLGDDELHGGAGADVMLGGAGNDILQTGGGQDWVFGGDGDDMIVVQLSGGAAVFAGAGNDTIVSVAAGKDVLWGDGGRDTFEFAVVAAPTEGLDDVIMDWGADDRLRFAEVSAYSILPRSYSEFVADSYAQALAIANQHISGPGAVYVAAQVGDDVIVFVNADGNSADGADIAVVLDNCSLDAIGLENFV